MYSILLKGKRPPGKGLPEKANRTFYKEVRFFSQGPLSHAAGGMTALPEGEPRGENQARSSRTQRAAKTPLAEAWDREWVTPEQSPMT